MRETQVQSLCGEDPPEKEMVTHSSILAWRIPWMEKPGRLQSMGLQRVRHDWVTSLSLTFYKHGDFQTPSASESACSFIHALMPASGTLTIWKQDLLLKGREWLVGRRGFQTRIFSDSEDWRVRTPKTRWEISRETGWPEQRFCRRWKKTTLEKWVGVQLYMQLGPLEQHWSRNTQWTVCQNLTTRNANCFTTRTGKKQQEGRGMG